MEKSEIWNCPCGDLTKILIKNYTYLWDISLLRLQSSQTFNNGITYYKLKKLKHLFFYYLDFKFYPSNLGSNLYTHTRIFDFKRLKQL